MLHADPPYQETSAMGGLQAARVIFNMQQQPAFQVGLRVKSPAEWHVGFSTETLAQYLTATEDHRIDPHAAVHTGSEAQFASSQRVRIA